MRYAPNDTHDDRVRAYDDGRDLGGLVRGVDGKACDEDGKDGLDKAYGVCMDLDDEARNACGDKDLDNGAQDVDDRAYAYGDRMDPRGGKGRGGMVLSLDGEVQDALAMEVEENEGRGGAMVGHHGVTSRVWGNQKLHPGTLPHALLQKIPDQLVPLLIHLW